jgi:hypothetical protein
MFTGTTNAFAQLTTATNPITPLSCVAGATEPLHPYAGVSYNYVLDGASGEETASIYSWWATKDPDFITAEGVTNMGTALASPDVTGTSANYGVATDIAVDNTANQVTIIWGTDILASTEWQGDVTAAGTPTAPSPTFVVGYATGLNCADNIQVFEINPAPSFVVDIAPVNPADDLTLPYDDLTAEDCVDQVQSAIYDNTSKELTMDYGTNVIYFEVAAANFVTDWTPTFTLMGGLNGDQTALLELYPTLADAQASSGALGSNLGSEWTSGVGTWASGVNLTAADPLDISTGVSAFVKVTITNNTYESLTSSPFVLAVDAQDQTETGIWDMEDDDCTAVTDAADQADEAQIIITPRPQLDDATTTEAIPNPDAPVVKTVN